MKITIITPTYNQGEFIEKTITSVINQTHKDIEYIIVDNESDDGTREIIEKYQAIDPRIIYIREADNGQAQAINKGFERATGDIVGWLNSDDFFYNDKVLERVNNAFKRHSKTKVITGDAVYSDREGNPTYTYRSDKNVQDWVITRWYYIVQPSTFWRKSSIRLDESYHYAFDWKFFIEMFTDSKVIFTHEIYSVYRMYEDNKTGLDNAKRKKEIYRLQKEIAVSSLNVKWCKYVADSYEKAEKIPSKTLENKIKKRIEIMNKILFHITFKRICCF